ncbi:hypothetical protein GWI33_003192 [Rhynchophorus ferrugineus]|uniref:MD-2-related lipid-recognition domain-containing protein n=1 Tax=Rhynchophorus ferrugineus TaxID=354439 RepID=A0A834IVM0_RHYFE|nr:hypothetical protein GWI33_003192 [Rhynchophorus ferrugineus]
MQAGVILLFLGLLSYGICDMDFVDCGTGDLFVEEVQIEGCSKVPCILYRSSTYTVNIKADHLDPMVTSVDLEATANVRGALFYIEATSDHPCVVDCPLQTRLTDPQIPINIFMNRYMMPGLTNIMVKATFKNNNQVGSSFCVKFDVDVY